MTELDAEIGPLALDLINEFGKLIKYGRVTTTGYNVATATTGVSEDFVDVRAIVEDYNLQSGGQGFASGLIEAGDKKVTIAAKSLEYIPTTNDLLEIDDITYKVVNVKIVYSGDLAALYELQGRQ